MNKLNGILIEKCLIVPICEYGIIVNVNGISVDVEFAACIRCRPLCCSYDINSPLPIHTQRHAYEYDTYKFSITQ